MTPALDFKLIIYLVIDLIILEDTSTAMRHKKSQSRELYIIKHACIICSYIELSEIGKFGSVHTENHLIFTSQSATLYQLYSSKLALLEKQTLVKCKR